MNKTAMIVGTALLSSAAMAQPEVRTDNSGFRASAIANASGQARSAKGGSTDAATWSSLGPYGGDIYDVSVSPINANIVLAGLAPSGSVGGSMYRSTDGGATWTIVATLNTTSVYDIEFAPDGTAYAGTVAGIYKSTDSGSSWTPLNLGIGANQQIFDITIDPTNSQILWAGVADALGNQPNNVIKSVNGGGIWTNATPPIGAAQTCRAIAINPANTQVMAAAFGGAFGGGQVWVSSNGGGTWTNRSAGLPATPMTTIVHDGTRFLIGGGQLFGSQFFGLFSSPDLGVSWTPLHNGTWPSQVINKIALNPTNVTDILIGTTAGIFHSTTGGASWSFGVGGTAPLSVNAVRYAPASAARAFLGASAAGIYQTTDDGATFNASSVGIGALDVYSVAANPNNSNDIAIAFQGQNNGGIFRSANGGQTWALENCPGTRYNTVRFTFDGTLYAISDGPSTIAPEALYRRNPNGTWTSIGPDQGSLFESELFGMRFSHNNPNLIIASGSDFGVAGFKGTIWRTPDLGAHWTKVYLGPDDSHPVVDVEIVENGTDQTMVASYLDNTGGGHGGALRSIDNGQSWAPSNTGLPTLFQGSTLTTSPGNPLRFFLSNRDFSASANGGLFQSIDGGASWTSTGYNAVCKFLDGDPTNPLVLYITQPGSGGVQDRVLQSQDGGVTFQLFSDGLIGADGFSSWIFAAGGPNPKLLMSTNKGTYGINLGSSCYADCDGVGGLTGNDFQCFLNAYVAGQSYANCDGVGGLTGNDFQCFLDKYVAGCS